MHWLGEFANKAEKARCVFLNHRMTWSQPLLGDAKGKFCGTFFVLMEIRRWSVTCPGSDLKLNPFKQWQARLGGHFLHHWPLQRDNSRIWKLHSVGWAVSSSTFRERWPNKENWALKPQAHSCWCRGLPRPRDHLWLYLSCAVIPPLSRTITGEAQI